MYEENSVDQTERCRRCLNKYKGSWDCSRCPTEADLTAQAREEVPGQTSMFDLLGGEEE